MKPYEWSKAKNTWLKATRGISFEEISGLIEKGEVIDVIQNPSKNFPHQKAYVLEVRGYAYVVPFVEDPEKIFLKTAYPNRKLTKIYLKKEEYEEKK